MLKLYAQRPMNRLVVSGQKNNATNKDKYNLTFTGPSETSTKNNGGNNITSELDDLKGRLDQLEFCQNSLSFTQCILIDKQNNGFADIIESLEGLKNRQDILEKNQQDLATAQNALNAKQGNLELNQKKLATGQADFFH